MKYGDGEFEEVREMFEKVIRKHFGGRLDREVRGTVPNDAFYQDGAVNTQFHLFMHGYECGKVMNRHTPQTAWDKSHDLVRLGQQSEVANQNAVLIRAHQIIQAMDHHQVSREDAEKHLEASCFGPRLVAMVDESVTALLSIRSSVAAMQKGIGN